VPSLAWTSIFLFMLSAAVGMTGAHHCAQPLVEMGTCELSSQAALNS
jgi:hypothetical protein